MSDNRYRPRLSDYFMFALVWVMIIAWGVLSVAHHRGML